MCGLRERGRCRDCRPFRSGAWVDPSHEHLKWVEEGEGKEMLLLRLRGRGRSRA